MMVPIQTREGGPSVARGADFAMDLYEREGAYVADVFVAHCAERALRVETKGDEVAVNDCTGALMRLRLGGAVDLGRVTAVRGVDLLTITMPKRHGAPSGAADVRGWLR